MPRLLMVVLLAATLPAAACECWVRGETPEEWVSIAAHRAAAVVLAVPIEQFSRRALYPPADSMVDWQEVHWKILRTWKGQFSEGDSLVTDTVTTCCLCGRSVKVGEVNLLYLSEAEPHMVSSCPIGGPLPNVQWQIPLLDSTLGTATARRPSQSSSAAAELSR